MTPLMATVSYNPYDGDIIEYLLRYGADPSVHREIDGKTALHLIAEATVPGTAKTDEKKLKLKKNMELLLDEPGVDPDVWSLRHGETPAHLAAMKKNLDVGHMLKVRQCG